jgi:pimeloyl-ACP methyl ester carboxylesterase
MPDQGDIKSEEFWAQKGDLKLYMYRKYAGARPGPENPRPVFFMVHGSSFCARTGFDLTVPGKDDYSFMDAFAKRGFDVWTMDHDGYGRSDHSGGNSDIATAVGDLSAGCDVVEKETGQKSYAFYGSSSGALRAAIYAEKFPDKIERLILDAHVYTGKGSPTLEKRRDGLNGFRASNMRAVDKDFFLSIFTRDKPGTSEEGVGEALAATELALCNQVPTGTYLDMCANLPVNDPAHIKCPVQIIRGEFDGIASEEDLIDFYMRLPNKDKQFVIIRGQAHVSPLGLNRHRFWHVVEAFLTMPKRLDD